MRCTWLAANTGRKKSPSRHHRTTLLGYIFAIKGRIDNRKNLLNSNTSSTCPDNMVNFSALAAEIGSGIWGTPAKFPRVSRLGSVTAQHSGSRRQPNFAAVNRGRPSRLALTHILVFKCIHLCCKVNLLVILKRIFYALQVDFNHCTVAFRPFTNSSLV